jgi:hypothetical protein
MGYTRIPPYSGTLRLYVDGTAGNDSNDGSSWALAWKSCAKVETGVASLLTTNPTSLQIVVYVRGVFANEDLRLEGSLCGCTRVHIIHTVADWTETATGTLNTIAATALAHGLRECTFNAPWVPDATDLGRWLVLTAGTQTIVYQVLRVNAGTVTINTATVPAWVVGGGGVSVSVRQPSVTGLKTVFYGMHNGDGWDPNYYYKNVVLGVACVNFVASQTTGLSLAIRASGATSPIQILNSAEVQCEVNSATTTIALLQEFGLLGTNVADTTRCSCCSTAVGIQWVSYGNGGSNVFSGYAGGPINTNLGVHAILRRLSAQAHLGETQSLTTVSNSIIRCSSAYGVSVGFGGKCSLATTSFVDLPAAGVSSALALVSKGGSIQLASTVDGINTGTAGSGLVALKAEKGAKVQFESGPNTALDGKHGFLRAVDAHVTFSAAVSRVASEGGGPDLYIEGGEIYFADNVTKSAVNSETAIQNGANGEIVAIGTKFKSATAAFTAAHVGRSIKVSGSGTPANNAVHLITAFTSATEVIIGSAIGLVNDGPGLTWGLVGTPRPILEVARGSKVTQASGKTFSVKCPEVDPVSGLQDWNKYGYGASGFLFAHENCDVTLGTLVEPGGIATAVDEAANIVFRSSLIHGGGAIILGVAPLIVGGTAAAAWPATAVNDFVAVTSQGCIVIPNV